jgi:hypothetical protein
MADEVAAVIQAMIDSSATPNPAGFSLEEIQVVGRQNLNPDGFAIDVYPADPFRTPDAAGFGDITGAVNWVVRARIAGDRDAEQDLLLLLMDEESDFAIATALMDDQTLNGLASSVEVDGPSGYTLYADGPGDSFRLGVEWRVTVLRAYS